MRKLVIFTLCLVLIQCFSLVKANESLPQIMAKSFNKISSEPTENVNMDMMYGVYSDGESYFFVLDEGAFMLYDYDTKESTTGKYTLENIQYEKYYTTFILDSIVYQDVKFKIYIKANNQKSYLIKLSYDLESDPMDDRSGRYYIKLE